MIYITQLIYIKPGQEKVFDEFENIAIPTIAKYNGKLLMRLRPDAKTYIECNMEAPYEIHLVSFESEEDFERFKNDEERKKYLHLKEQAIREAAMILGNKV